MQKNIEKELLLFLKKWKKKLESEKWYSSPELYVEPNWDKLIQDMSQFKLLCQQYTDIIHKTQDKKIFCRSGCSTCCHHSPESVEPLELFTIYGLTKKNDSFVKVLEKAYFNIRQFDQLRKIVPQKLSYDDQEEWLCVEYFKQQFPCSFLKDNICQIYDIRPLTCAFYGSHSDPKYCKPEFIQSAENLSFLSEMPESCEELWREINQPFDIYDISTHLFSGILDVNTLESQWHNNRNPTPTIKN
jgi:Fe-S-cluster containining protein